MGAGWIAGPAAEIITVPEPGAALQEAAGRGRLRDNPPESRPEAPLKALANWRPLGHSSGNLHRLTTSEPSREGLGGRRTDDPSSSTGAAVMAQVVWKRLADFFATRQLQPGERLTLSSDQLCTVLGVKVLPPFTSRVTAWDPVMGKPGGLQRVMKDAKMMPVAFEWRGPLPPDPS